MKDQGTCQGKKQVSEIEDEMSALNTAMSKLINVIDELEVRLSPVLRPLTPADEIDPKPMEAIAQVPLAATIRKEAGNMLGQVEKVEGIFRRLGI
jgi:hypothetical protein